MAEGSVGPSPGDLTPISTARHRESRDNRQSRARHKTSRPAPGDVATRYCFLLLVIEWLAQGRGINQRSVALSHPLGFEVVRGVIVFTPAGDGVRHRGRLLGRDFPLSPGFLAVPATAVRLTLDWGPLAPSHPLGFEVVPDRVTSEVMRCHSQRGIATALFEVPR